MTLSHDNKRLSIEEAEDFNYKQRVCQAQVYGCITSLACIHCGLIVNDSLCLCVGCFICPGCDKQNGLPTLGLFPVEKYKIMASNKFVYEG